MKSQTPVSLWALLIGVNRYQFGSKLRGCINDVEAMKLLLINQLAVPSEQIFILINEQATREGILQAFADFLIDNPSIKLGDQILIHYSGHGSRMPDLTGLEPDGYGETIVPYDSRTPGVYDISDKTIAALLDSLAAQKGDNITVILDCCHSASGTRDLDTHSVGQLNLPESRSLPLDDRIPPSGLDANLPIKSSTTRFAKADNLHSHVLLAACRAHEKAYEYRAELNLEACTEVWHGALTYFILQVLKSGNLGMTYRDLHERVATYINSKYPQQMPQCEGDRDRLIFGGLRIHYEPFIKVVSANNTGVKLDAGLAHGLRQGTELAIYPSKVRAKQDLVEEPLAVAKVISVTATTAEAILEEGSKLPIPERARAIVTKQVYSSAQQTVALHADVDPVNECLIAQLSQAIKQAAPGKQPSPYLKLTENSDAPADLYVVATDQNLGIYGEDGNLLVLTEDSQDDGRDVIAVLHSLGNIARYRAVLRFSNEDSNSRLASQVQVRLLQLTKIAKNYEGKELAESTKTSSGVVLEYQPEDASKNFYAVEITNNSNCCLYPHVFIMSSDFSIHSLYPTFESDGKAVNPQKVLQIGTLSGSSPLEIYLPDGWESSQDYLKVILTTQPTNLQIFTQTGLNVAPPYPVLQRSYSSSLEEIIGLMFHYSENRHIRPAHSSPEEDWTTFEIPICVTRSKRSSTYNVS